MLKNKINMFVCTIIFMLLSCKIKCAIYLPFKILENDENSSLIDTWNNSKYYSELMIGDPPIKISVFLVSNIFELTLFQNMCDIPNSFYNIQNSSSYNFIKNIYYYFNKVMNCTVVTEQLYLFTDKEQKNKVCVDDVVIVYSDNKEEDFNQDYIYKKDNEDKIYEYHPNTCLNIGFQPRQNFNFGGNANFVKQIRRYTINNISLVNTSDYTFSFTSDKDGYVIIGEKPHEFDKNNYAEDDYILTGAKERNYTFEWLIEFDSIYYDGIYDNNNTKYNSTFICDLSVKIDHTYGLIEGTSDYEKNFAQDFFNKLINNNQCFIEENEGLKYYYCDKKSSIKYIEKYFPVLKLCLNEYEFCFEFGYKDLFREKNDKLYFLIYFNSNNPTNRFTFGQIFLKKYLLTFNYDNKMIGFYNKNKNESNEEDIDENDERNNLITYIILLIFAFILVFFLGCLVGKKIYQARKRKANELLDDHDYNSQEQNNIN